MDYAQAFLDLVKAALAHRPDIEVYDHSVDPDVDDVPTRYVVVYVQTPQALASVASDDVSGHRLSARVICCSSSSGEAGWEVRRMATTVRDYLTARRLRPGGQKIKHHPTGEPGGEPELLVSRRVVEANDGYTALN